MVKDSINSIGGKKAVIFTFDAVVALLVAGFIVSAILFNYHAIERTQQQDKILYDTASQLLGVAEYNGVTQQIVDSVADIAGFIDDTLPPSLCGNFSLYDNSGSLVDYDEKLGCDSQSPTRKAVAYRSYMSDQKEFYYAVFEVWTSE